MGFAVLLHYGRRYGDDRSAEERIVCRGCTWSLREQLATISKGRVVVHKRFVCSTKIHSREHSATKCVPSEVLPEVST